MTKQIASISISGEITLNMHSLNNEGGEADYDPSTNNCGQESEHTVNGISEAFNILWHLHCINRKRNRTKPSTQATNQPHFIRELRLLQKTKKKNEKARF